MPKKTSPEDVSVLSSARNGLTYLTANDWALIADKAARLQFKAGEFVVRKGKRTHGVYMLLKGTAAVQLPQGGRRLSGRERFVGKFRLSTSFRLRWTSLPRRRLRLFTWTGLRCRGCLNCFRIWGHDFIGRWLRVCRGV